ncbi:MAG: glycosyltransferase family 4 protein [Clostridium sp.]|uniref:glycosyltransferase family 4 protein n=1 Tax=Clostridium sp. TaxID=1506 RepID=UPI0025C3FEB1|nr:glycosyltransferase family 4 protein [Clostridium sp.]MCF0149763.1 glycosyltransferase family 4 protein [Clostridium sp.]
MKKKLLYVINHLRSGAVPNILLDITPFIKENFQVSVLALQEINYDDNIVDKFKNQSIKVESLSLKRNDIVKGYYQLRRYLLIHKPDLIHSHLGRADFLSAICKPHESKLITTFHSVKSNYNPLTRLGYFFTDKYVYTRTAVSNAVRDSWYKSNKLKNKIRTIYNPIDVDKFTEIKPNSSLKRELGVSEKDFIILNVGNLRKQKGQIYLVKALNIVLKKYKNVKLIIVGRKGDAEEDIINEINKLNLNNNVILLGFRNDIPDLLKNSDLFVFPSLTEGLGIAVLEAMAARIPVIASDIDAINEYVTDGVNGLLVKYNDINTIAKKIEFLLENNNFKEELSSSAFNKVMELFDSETIAKQYIELYNELI